MEVPVNNYRSLRNASVDTGIVKRLADNPVWSRAVTAKYMTNTKNEMYDFYLCIYIQYIYIFTIFSKK